MFEGFLEKFLLKYFGEYLKGIDKTNLSVAVWKGEISVRTVDINPDILRKHGIPLKMVFGKIESLLLKVPWNNLGGKPVEVEIDSISLVLLQEDIANWYSSQNYLDYCMALIDGVKDEMFKKLEEEFEKQDKKSSFFEQIFDNLKVSVKNIHIRVENLFGRSFAFGGILEDFNMMSVDQSGNSVFVKRLTQLDKVTKMISFKNLILYHDTKPVSGKDSNIIDYFFKSHNLNNAHKIINLTLDIIFTVSPYNKDDPLRNTPIYQFSTDISNIRLSFETEMIRDMTTLLDCFNQYKNSKFEFLEKQKFNIFKPQITAKRDYKKLWKFAFKCVQKERRSKLSGLVLFTLGIVEKSKLQQELTQLLPKSAENKLSKSEESRFKWLIQIFSLKELTDIVKMYTYEHYKQGSRRLKSQQEQEKH